MYHGDTCTQAHFSSESRYIFAIHSLLLQVASVIKYCQEHGMSQDKTAQVMAHYARHRAADSKFASPFAYAAFQVRGQHWPCIGCTGQRLQLQQHLHSTFPCTTCIRTSEAALDEPRVRNQTNHVPYRHSCSVQLRGVDSWLLLSIHAYPPPPFRSAL